MLAELRLQNFRVFSDFLFSPKNKTIIIGDNGTGKSTLVEAIRILSVNKSFRTSRFDEVISFEQPFLRLTGETEDTDHKKHKLEFFYGQPFAEQATKERITSIDGKSVGLLDYVGNLPSVLFVPNDVDIVLGLPGLRRKYLDGILWQTSAEFRQNFSELSRILKERSTLLFLIKINRAGLDELSPWNELLLRTTRVIRDSRVRYVEYLKSQAVLIDRQKNLNLVFDFNYHSEVDDLDSVMKDEIRLSQNLFGPHRDELVINFQERLARRYASRGQARTIAALLKVVEISYLHQELQKEPLVLLDDIFSELDQTNTELLFDNIPEKAQIIVTSLTNQSYLKDYNIIEL